MSVKHLHQGGVIKKLMLAVSGLFFVGCASVQSPVPGALYLDAKGGVGATSIPAGSLRGEACATTILGLVGTGDASIKTAAQSAGIQKIAVIDHTSFNILGFYGKYCTVVYGAKGKAMAAAPKKGGEAADAGGDDF